MTLRLALPLLTLTVTALLTACGPDGAVTPPDTNGPSVTLTASPTTVTAAGSVTLAAEANDDTGVTRVDFYRGTTLFFSDTEAPYTTTDSVTASNNGTLSYTARATDAAGNSATSPVVTVNVSISTAICPQTLGSGAAFPAASVIQTSVAAPNWSAPHVPGQVLVTDASGALSAQALNVLSAVHTQQVVEGVRLAETPAGETDRAFAARLAAAGLRAQPNFLYQPLAVPNDPGYPGNVGVKLADSSTTYFQDYLTRIRADRAWDFLDACGKTPVGALTAVLDSGVDAGHPDLQGRLLPGVTFADSGTDTNDETGHGTGVAGLMAAATNNRIGLAGVTWTGKTVLPVKVFNTGTISTAALAKGLDYAVKQGAKVINMSLGAPHSGDPTKDPGDKALDDALGRAARSAVLVAAAGNTSVEGVYYPASNPNVIAVGAVGNRDDTLACYSARPNAARPRGLDIVAPGGGGAGICGTSRRQDILVLAPGGGYQFSVGTSEAAPLVSGVAALMRAVNPDLTAAQTRELLLASVRRIGSPDFPETGLPLLDAEAAVRAATR